MIILSYFYLILLEITWNPGVLLEMKYFYIVVLFRK